MKLTKNTRLSKKPFKADNGAILSNSTTQYGKPKPYQVDSFGNNTNSPGIDISKKMDISEESSKDYSALSPKSFDYSSLATTGATIGIGAIENQQAHLASVNKAPSLSGEMGKGALKGASYIAPVALNPAMLTATAGLSALAVPVAAGIGAGVNYVTGNKKINAFNSAKETARKNFLSSQESFAKQNSQYNMLDAVNRGYSTQGSNMSSFYKNGGVVYKQGGSLNPISSDTKLAVGRSHEQGGIKMSEDAEIEGGETVVDKGDHTLVVSDNLVNPITGRTFAKDDLRLAKLARKYEGVTTQLAKNSLKHIQAKREALHDLQQQMNGYASDVDTAQNGGKLNRDAQLSADKRKYLELLSKDGRNQASTQERLAIKDYQKSLYEKGLGSDYAFPFVDAGSQLINGARKVFNTLTDNHYQNGGKMKPINMLIKPIKTAVPSRPRPMLAQNGGKLRPINILTKPVKTSPRPSTHLAENGMKLYQRGGEMKTSTKGGQTYKGGSGSLYNINSKGERFIQKPGGQWVKTDKFPDSVEKQFGSSNTPAKLDLDKLDNSTQPFRVGDTNPVDGETIGERVAVDNKYSPTGSKVTDVKDISYKGSSNNQPSTSKGNSTGKNLRKAWDKTKEVGEAALPTLSRAGKLASYAAPALAQYYANKADIARQKGMKIPDAPQQGFQSLAKQNMEADRAAIRKQQADFNAGVAGTLADSQTAALLKANMASKAGDALVGVNQAERKANIATANAQTEMNLGIDTRNKLAKYQQAGMQLEKDIDLSRRRAGNVAELSANIQQVQDVDRREKWADADTLVKVAGLEDRGIKYLDNIGANPAGHYTGRKLLISRNGGKLTKLRR